MRIEIVSPRRFGLTAVTILLVGMTLPLARRGQQVVAAHAPTAAVAVTAVVLPTATWTPSPTSTRTPAPDNVQAYLDGCRRRQSDFAFPADYSGARVLPSCNHGGENRPQAVVVHATEGGLTGALERLRDPQSQVSAHYVIDRDGTVYQLVPERLTAYHVSCGGGCVLSCPAFLCGDGKPEGRTIGIELVNLGKVPQNWPGAMYEDYGMAFGWRWWEDYPQAQRESLKRLVGDIAARWGIPLDPDHVLGHYRIQGKRDPGPALNLFWERNGVPACEPLWKR